LRFRADRIEQIGSGARWTDFKTGAPINSGKPATMRKHHLAGIAAGTRLQAVAYALAAQSGGAGRYLFLKERADENARVFEIENGDAEAHESFDAAVETLLASWDLGAFAPRLLDASRVKDNAECKRCEVALACVRGDSTAHRRLAAFLDSAGDADDESTRAARTILDLQRPAPKPAKPGEEEAS
jgi:hypothetical protein